MALGTAQAEMAYQLTTAAVEQQAAAVVPLLLLSFSAIAEGLAAYAASLAGGKAAGAATRVQWQSALQIRL
ncbi:MAG TPA: hypothetical protein VJW77_03100 [Terriglobia bacterium]|nr:hypothetical protein [Terriglobia bacterium]